MKINIPFLKSTSLKCKNFLFNKLDTLTYENISHQLDTSEIKNIKNWHFRFSNYRKCNICDTKSALIIPFFIYDTKEIVA